MDGATWGRSAALLLVGIGVGAGGTWIVTAERVELASASDVEVEVEVEVDAFHDAATDAPGREEPASEAAVADTDDGGGDGQVWTDRAEDKPKISRAQHPNVLVLMWDTVRADHVSLYGYGRETTPWLDGLADRARVWETAIAPGFWTVPSHASIFSGVPVSVHRAESIKHWLRNGYVTMPEWFRDHGYDTYLFTANPNLAPRTNLVQGFEHVEGTRVEPWRTKAAEWHRGKRIPRDASSDRSPAFPGSSTTDANKDAGPVAAEALFQWVDGRSDADVPFFAFVNYMEAHIPRLPSMESREALLDPELIELGLQTFTGFKKQLELTQGTSYYTPRQHEAMLGVYDAAIRDLDRASGQLVAELERRGLLDDTIVVVVADHGEGFGEHEIYGHNFSIHDEIVHVPLVIHWPAGLEPGRTRDAVSTASLYPTLVSLAGLPQPDLGLEVPDLRQPGELAVTELLAFHGQKPDTPLRYRDGTVMPLRRRYRATVQGDLKLIEASDGQLELYDRRADPDETTNLADQRPAEARELQRAHAAWRRVLPERVELERGELQQFDRVKDAAQSSEDLRDELEALGYVQ